MAKYADGTTTTVESSEQEIRRTLKNYEVTQVVVGHGPGRGLIEFELRNRRLRYEIVMPPVESFRTYERKGSYYPVRRTDKEMQRTYEAEERRRWRVMLLHIKSQLNVAEDGSVPFDDVFMANIVLPDGTTIGQQVTPRVAQAYLDGHVMPLLEDLSRRAN